MTRRPAVCAPHDHALSRRLLLKGGLVGGLAFGGFGRLFAADAAKQAARKQKNVILVWMSGGPSQFETWDPKPGRPTGGPHLSTPTALPGIHFDEHMPRMAQLAKRMVTVRSMASKNGDHGQAQYIGQTSYEPSRATTPAPHWLSILAHERPPADVTLPAFVNIGTENGEFANPGAGYLGSKFGPLVCPQGGKPPENLPLDSAVVTPEKLKPGLDLRAKLAERFGKGRDAKLVESHESAFGMLSGLLGKRGLFDVTREPQTVRDAYGGSNFGRDCLMARRLVEAGVPFVRVQQQGGLAWDKHRRAFESQRHITAEWDTAVGALIDDLIERGLWANTLVVTMGEFGRTPDLGGQGTPGRNHWTKCWSLAFGGCGLKEGVVIGATNADGTDIKDRPVSIHDLFCTFYKALDLDPHTELEFEGRPIPFVENKLGKPLAEVV